MHLHVEFLIMEAVFEHFERTLAEIVDNYVLYSTPANRTPVCYGKPSLLLEKKSFQSVESLSYFFGLFVPTSLSRYSN